MVRGGSSKHSLMRRPVGKKAMWPSNRLLAVGLAAPFVAYLLYYVCVEASVPKKGSLQAPSQGLAVSKQVLVPIADGSEEIETACITDTLSRFGATVTVASVMPKRADDTTTMTTTTTPLVCTMSRGLKVVADCTIEQAIAKGADYWDMVVLPGGMPGATHLRDSAPLIELLRHQKETAKKYYAAICASPGVVLAPHGLLDVGAKVTGYPAPSFMAALNQQTVVNKPVVIDNNLITGQGPAAALDFALSLGEILFGKEKRDQVAKDLGVK